MEKFTTEGALKLRSIFESESFKSLVDSTIKSADTDTGTFEVIITTENLDRYQEVISIDGWELDHYLNNPVVLWGHDHSKLIGVCTSLTKRDGKLVAKGKFAPTEEGQEKRKLYEQGFLKATSVGFIEKEREGNLITKAELLEFSFVSVPANPYALSLAIKTERSIDELVTKGIFTIQEEKGAVSEEIASQEAFEKKWKNFSQIDDVIYSFWRVYFDKETPVGDFNKLLDETVAILKDISGGKKDIELTGAIKEILTAPEKHYENAEKNSQESTELANLITKQVLAGLKDSGALEATPSEPERTDDEPVEDVEEDPAVKDFENRKKLQQIDTILGEVLADIRSKNTHRS